MKKTFGIFILFLSLGVYAQSDEEMIREILEYKLCYEQNKSHGLVEQSFEIDGEVFDLMSECHFANENIVVSDKDELQKVADKISYDIYGIPKKFGYIVDWKSIRVIFQNSMIETEQVAMNYMQEGTFQLLCHGLTQKGQTMADKVLLDNKELDAQKTAEIILEAMDGYEIITNYTNRPLVVVIHSCNVGGKSDDSFASKVSGLLAEKSANIYVVAAPYKVVPTTSTWPYYSERIVTPQGKQVKWNCFHNGKFLMEGEFEFDKTVTKIQNKYYKK